MASGSARVLLRMASASELREFSASGDISGEASSMGCTPTASTMPASTSSAAYRRWLHRHSARPATPTISSRKLIAMATPDSMYVCEAVVVNAYGSRT